MNARLVIEGELTVFAVHALKEQLLAEMAALGQGEVLELDLGGVSEVDGAGIQLLLAARREALHRGFALRLADAPPVLAEALNLIDVQPVFSQALAALEETTA